MKISVTEINNIQIGNIAAKPLTSISQVIFLVKKRRNIKSSKKTYKRGGTGKKEKTENRIVPPAIIENPVLSISGISLVKEIQPIRYSPIQVATKRNIRHLTTPASPIVPDANGKINEITHHNINAVT
jgi:hypothetical protein